MPDKLIRVAAATPSIELANCDYNADRIIDLMQKAQGENVNILCLSELCITGATCGDLFLQPTLTLAARAALHKIVRASLGSDMVVVVGLPLGCMTDDGYRVHNVAAVFQNGRIGAFVQNLYPAAQFSPIHEFPVPTIMVDFDGERVALGHDIVFACANEPGLTFTVQVGASDFDISEGRFLVINPSSIVELVGVPESRRKIVEESTSRWDMYATVTANAGWGESTTDRVFSGHNIVAADGKILAESEPFGTGWAVADINLSILSYKHELAEIPNIDKRQYIVPFSIKLAEVETTFDPNDYKYAARLSEWDMDEGDITKKDNPCLPFVSDCPDPDHALQIQAAGLARRIQHTGAKAAVIGVSGGLDSCLALLVAARSYKMLGRDLSDVCAVTLPCFGTTAHTKNNAHALCTALGIPCMEIDMTVSVTQHLSDIGHPRGVYDVVFENAQARARTMVLMNIANQVGGFVVGTGSLSELALGWATYNGDHMSMYAVNAGVPKTLVRHIVEHVASTTDNVVLGKVLEAILATKVSPELLPTTQNTEELVGPYELHDFFIYHMLGELQQPSVIFDEAKIVFRGKYTSDEIRHWQDVFTKRFFAQQFKRNCLPDAPQVVGVSLSPRVGLFMPSDASAAAWLV